MTKEDPAKRLSAAEVYVKLEELRKEMPAETLALGIEASF
jgi:hypothetical protein